MLKALSIVMLVILLTLSVSTVANAASAPVGSCPTAGGFTLMEVMLHDAMEHTHAGLAADLNGDGYLCMRMATDTIHVHMDNALPLQ